MKKSSRPKINKMVSVIIVSWNGLHWLKRSLPSLSKVNYKYLEIILVDNCSTDGTTYWVNEHFPEITILQMNQNLGFAEANNRGFENAKGDYILFLNNDVEVDPLFITNLIETIDNDSSIAGAQSKILLLDDKTRYDSIGAFLTPTGFLYHYCFRNKIDVKNDKIINLYTPKGACMLFKRLELQRVLLNGKLFDSDAFAYFEESDMAHRIWLSGKRIVYAPKSVIFHKMGGTSSSMDNAFIQFHSFKNRMASYLKNVSITYLIPLLFVHLVVVEIYAFIALFKGKFSVALAIQKAIFWNIKHIVTTYKKRVFIQKNIRKVSDNTYWDKVIRFPSLSYYLAQMNGTSYNE